MIWKKALNYPILFIGILFFIIFILSLGKDRPVLFNKKFLTTSCEGMRTILRRKLPDGWTFTCRGNNLELEAYSDTLMEPGIPKAKLYRELANSLSIVAQVAPEELLSRVDLVTIKLIHNQMDLIGLTKGVDLVKLRNMRQPGFIAQHLKQTTKVQERLKSPK